MELAQRRAIEVSSDFSHAGWVAGTAEVLAWNSGSPDPAATTLAQWQGSPDHWAILTDPQYTLIGCGAHQVAERLYVACVLAAGPAPTPNPPVIALPNTALEAP
jgi:hypothetical protein